MQEMQEIDQISTWPWKFSTTRRPPQASFVQTNLTCKDKTVSNFQPRISNRSGEMTVQSVAKFPETESWNLTTLKSNSVTSTRDDPSPFVQNILTCKEITVSNFQPRNSHRFQERLAQSLTKTPDDRKSQTPNFDLFPTNP